ncbi:MAG: hypothetical protein IJG16_11550, partial [Clostridia bacterium]|nr:hypothetical protein [Clostridia bacterium]
YMQEKITCMYHSHHFTQKPQGKECGWVQKSLTKTDITIENLAIALCYGASFKPAVLEGGNKAENWKQQQLFGLDFDEGITIEEAYNKVVSLGITPCFLYTTFSHKEQHHKFRMIFCTDMVITDGQTRDKLQATLMGVIGGVDKVCFNRDRLFFGGKSNEVLYAEYDARIGADDIIKQYWKDDYEQYIPHEPNKKKKSAVVKKSKANNRQKSTVNVDYTDNTDAISTLNVALLQERLGIKGVLCNTDKRRSSLSVLTKSKNGLNTGLDSDNYIDIQQFNNEAELYDYINSIDLYEFLGVPNGFFRCILPKHKDDTASAHIYTTDDGTQIYKCFGCNQARTIVSITEQLSGCKRHEAIKLIKQVYKIDYKPTEWVEQQRKIMIDSALYLNSEEFKSAFPQFNKLIRTRKVDAQRILIHMTKYVNNDLTLDGKPLFFASLNNLMKICETKDKTKMSQSITLFALLNMLDKVDLERIPENELNKAKHISAQYGFKKITNFYQFEEYGYNTLENSEQIAGTLLKNNITLKGLSREYVLRTFGKELADKVFPQYRYEN